MSKETKLGLLGGMGAIILVAILVTDLLSVADRQEAAPLYDSARAAQFADPMTDQVEQPFTGTPATFERRTNPLPLPQEVDRSDGQDAAPAPQAEYTGPPVALAYESRPIGAGPAIGDHGQTVPPVTHVVRAGEDLWTIAKRYLGSPGKWRLIHQANLRAVPDPDVLRRGVRLVIPIQRTDGPAPEATAPMALRPYTVQKDDTLAKLAEKILGDADGWKKLHTLNQGRIDNPHRLPVGLEILVPDL